ncbi:MAG: hypothetical protein LBT00_06400, partial [Spirochaetaceae bacterium]|nr:hypothetical protein [Spirochaetaceae bacterium]
MIARFPEKAYTRVVEKNRPPFGESTPKKKVGEVAANCRPLAPAASRLTLPPLRGQNHAVHGFVGVPQASTDGRTTEYAPTGNPKQDVEGCRS